MNPLDALYAKIGRQAEQIENQNAAFDSLLNLLAQVISGEVATSRIMVNLTARTVTRAEAGARPAMPPTVNGVPVCVVAPEQA